LVIEERTFARFEAAEHGRANAAATAVELFPARGDLRLEIGRLQFFRERGDRFRMFAGASMV